ncbi:macrophage mannose receptor 1-like [Mercenaria mercenaria]|uniref:macrophage mannose receptor 1-like n=1 Tax=Mercenaria mercenaria TaxID=6596 RepID=UPI00234EA006|nr:macrophage mannose receptor 1-like [Mercenaria mercenaria]
MMMKYTDLVIVLFIVYITGTVQCDELPVCDDGWFPFNNTCYLVNNIKSISRSAAEAECSYYDSSLLQIDTSEQMDYLVSLMKMHPSSGYWTGLNDISRDILQKKGTGIWKWGHFHPADETMIQWNLSPTNDGQSNCAGINIQGKMEDRNCDSKQGFICKIGQMLEGCPLGWLETQD